MPQRKKKTKRKQRVIRTVYGDIPVQEGGFF